MITCIHEGDKNPILIKFLGRRNKLNACSECVEVINTSKVCEVLQ